MSFFDGLFSSSSESNVDTDDENGSGLIIKGDDVTFFPDIGRAKAACFHAEEALQQDGWQRPKLTPEQEAKNDGSYALEYVMLAMRGKVKSRVAQQVLREIGKDALPMPCPDDFLVVQDVSGKLRRSCDFYICRQRAVQGACRLPTEEAVEAAKEWAGTDGSVVCRGVELPNPPWQRSAQINGIWYRRTAVEGLGGRYDHKYRIHVPLFVSSRPKGWRVALPDGCIVDGRGFVDP